MLRDPVCRVEDVFATWAGAPWLCLASWMPASVPQRSEQVRGWTHQSWVHFLYKSNDKNSCVCVSDYEDVRGFVSGGYAELNNNEGSLTSLVCEGRQ